MQLASTKKQADGTDDNTANDELNVNLDPENTDTNQDDNADKGNDQGGDDTGGEQDNQDDDDEDVVTIEGVTPTPEEDDEQHQDTPTFRDLRKHAREQAKEIRDLKAKLTTPTTPAAEKPAAVVVGAKPTLEDSDYDADAFETALTAWHEAKRAAAAADDAVKAEQKAAADAWNAKVAGYNAGKAKLKVKDFDDAEAVVLEVLDTTQRGVIIHGTDNPALITYALGKNPGKAKELASIKDPVKFAVAIGELMTKLSVTNRKAAPPAPERTVQGTARSSGAVDSTLERLRADAAKTGDYLKVTAYKRDKRSA